MTDQNKNDLLSLSYIKELAAKLNSLCNLKIHKKSQDVVSDERSANQNIFHQFVKSINPIDATEWNDAGWFGKSVCVIKAPAILLLLLIIPIVDYSMDKHGWCKLLNVLHVCILPLAIVLLKKCKTN